MPLIPADDARKQTLRGVVAGNPDVNNPRPFRQLAGGACALLLVALLGATAYRIEGWSWSDSIYMVVITMFTVGYGEVRPVDTMELRVITIIVIIFGFVSTLLIVSGLAQLVIDGELRKSMGIRRMLHEIEKLQNHVIICGYGRMGQRLAERLRHRRDLLIVDNNEAKVQLAIEDGFLALRGSATEEDILVAAGIHRANTLAAVTPDDATCLFVTITARGLNPELTILARGEQPPTVQKLRQVGADHVVLSAAIGADRLGQLILRPTAANMLRNDQLPSGLLEDLESIGMAIDELYVEADSSLAGCRLGDLGVHSKCHFLIVAIRHANSHVVVDPDLDTSVCPGDTILVLGHEQDIRRLCREFRLHRNEEIVAEREAEPLQDEDETI